MKEKKDNRNGIFLQGYTLWSLPSSLSSFLFRPLHCFSTLSIDIKNHTCIVFLLDSSMYPYSFRSFSNPFLYNTLDTYFIYYSFLAQYFEMMTENPYGLGIFYAENSVFAHSMGTDVSTISKRGDSSSFALTFLSSFILTIMLLSFLIPLINNL